MTEPMCQGWRDRAYMSGMAWRALAICLAWSGCVTGSMCQGRRDRFCVTDSICQGGVIDSICQGGVTELLNAFSCEVILQAE